MFVYGQPAIRLARALSAADSLSYTALEASWTTSCRPVRSAPENGA